MLSRSGLLRRCVSARGIQSGFQRFKYSTDQLKVGIVGTGNVGATAAFSMVLQGVGRDIILVDHNTKRSKAEEADLSHAVPFTASPQIITAGDYSDLAGCKVVVVTAGTAQKPGESRQNLLKRNAAIYKDIIPSILKNAPTAILVIATNPVDVMTHLAARYAAFEGVPPNRVLGTGTCLDSARFAFLLSKQLGVDSKYVHAYVVGEHGDSEVLLWSHVTVGGLPLKDYLKDRQIMLDDEIKKDIDHKVRYAAYSIIDGKGSTFYGIGAAIATIVKAIIHNEKSIMTICAPMSTVAGIHDTTIAVPFLVGGSGVIAKLKLNLDDIHDEYNGVAASAQLIKDAIASVDDPHDRAE